MPPSRGRTCCLMRGGGVDGELVNFWRSRSARHFLFRWDTAPKILSLREGTRLRWV